MLVSHAGKLRSFHLVRDNKDQSSKGYAFCEFATLEGVQMAMQTVNGMQVLDQTPGMLGGTKTLNVRRTGIYANQSIDGGQLVGQVNGQNPAALTQGCPTPIDAANKQIFEQHLLDLIQVANFCTGNAERIGNLLQTEQRLDQAKEQVTTNNDLVKKYLKTQYHYEFCTTCVSITFKAFEDEATQKRILGGTDQEY